MDGSMGIYRGMCKLAKSIPFFYPGCTGLILLQFSPGDMKRNCSLWEEEQSWRKKSDSMAKPISFAITIVVIMCPFSTGLPLFPPVCLATTHYCSLWNSPQLCFVNYTQQDNSIQLISVCHCKTRSGTVILGCVSCLVFLLIPAFPSMDIICTQFYKCSRNRSEKHLKVRHEVQRVLLSLIECIGIGMDVQNGRHCSEMETSKSNLQTSNSQILPFSCFSISLQS